MMKARIQWVAAFGTIMALALAASGCQQGSDNNTAAAPAAAADNAAITEPPASMANAAAATGPVALATDASLPEQCQTYIREVQACLNGLTDPGEEEYATRIRDQLDFHRNSWRNVSDDGSRARICANDYRGFQEYKRDELPC